MVEIIDTYDLGTRGNFFTSYNKNLGNKLFIYACSRIMADLLGYDLICPENALIRRENQNTYIYENEIFPFGGITGRKTITSPTIVVYDNEISRLGSIESLLNKYPNHGFIISTYFSKYDYIKPYKEMVKGYFNNLVLPKREGNDIVIMLRNSNIMGNFVLPDKYYIDILENENFDNLYVSLDHKVKHESLLSKLEKYNPIFIEDTILNVFSQITSFNKIIASQGTFSFWACFLSNADVIYWPNTNDGPNSNNQIWDEYVNLRVDDEERYKHIKIEDIYLK